MKNREKYNGYKWDGKCYKFPREREKRYAKPPAGRLNNYSRDCILHFLFLERYTKLCFLMTFNKSKKLYTFIIFSNLINKLVNSNSRYRENILHLTFRDVTCSNFPLIIIHFHLFSFHFCGNLIHRNIWRRIHNNLPNFRSK